MPQAFLILAYCLEPDLAIQPDEPSSIKQGQCWAWTGEIWGPERAVVREALKEARRYPEILDALHECNVARHATEGKIPAMRTIMLGETKIGDRPARYDRYA